MRISAQLFLAIAVSASIVFSSCKKGFLDAKPNQSIVILNSIKNIQGILDNNSVMNGHPNLGEEGGDDYYLTTQGYMTTSNQAYKNIYTWASLPADDFYSGIAVNDWNQTYTRLFYANSAIEEINKITPGPAEYAAWANVRGSGLFFRASCFYDLAQIFCKTYIPASANTDLGIILRLLPDINLKYDRATVQQTYEQIINDLMLAKDLLPDAALYKTRPSKPAAYGMLAKTYLCMQQYDKALAYADSCLRIFSSLIDYNSLDTLQDYPMPFPFKNNVELIFYSDMGVSIAPNPGNKSNVDTALFQLYSINDLRRRLFFKNINNRLQFTGSYLGNGYHYSPGIATDEMFLVRAECFARKGNTISAMDDLNTLLVKRYKAGAFTPLTASSADEALQIILTERRKELCFRALRWTDLRRLNLEDRFKITLKREIGGQTYTLPPNDNRYVYPIPSTEILYNNIPQNPR